MTKIVFVYNNKMAFPVLQQLQNEGGLSAVIITDMHPEIIVQSENICSHSNLPLHIVSQKDFKTRMKEVLNDIQPDAVFVMTFPWRLPADILSIPRLGFFNFHAGKLPEMRGADPIFECVRQGMAEAGCCVHVMNEEFDKGAVVLQQTFPMSPEFTYGMLSGRMAHLAAQLYGELIKKIKNGDDITGVEQDEHNARYWPKVGIEAFVIHWDTMTWETIKALVKSCNPITKGAIATINGWQIGIYDVSEVNLEGDASHIKPGTVITADLQNGLLVYCKNGKALKIEVFYSEEGIMAGHKLAFYGIGPGSIFS